MQLKIKKLHPNARIPTYATDGSGCFDLYALTVNGSHHLGSNVDENVPVLCHTGIAVEIPDGYVMEIYSRSGHGFKWNTRLSNCTGIVDADYRGEIAVQLISDCNPGRFSTDPVLFVSPGDRIAQAKLAKAERVTFVEVDELSDTARGTGGFGSTGQ